MTLRATFLLLVVAAGSFAAPARAAAVYCHVQSDSRRGEGLIVSPVFEPRSSVSLAWLRQAFAGFLRNSYAPYGNNWSFREEGVQCASFKERAEAQAERDRLILIERRDGQNIYNVTFVGP